MNYELKVTIIETAKELLRIALFAAIAAVLAGGLEMLGALDQSNSFVVIATLLLKIVDKARFQYQKENNIELPKYKGLAGF